MVAVTADKKTVFGREMLKDAEADPELLAEWSQ